MILKFINYQNRGFLPIGDFGTYKGFIISKNNFKKALDEMKLTNSKQVNRDLLFNEFLIAKQDVADFTQKIKRQDIVNFAPPAPHIDLSAAAG
jgi:hypothetical protein